MKTTAVEIRPRPHDLWLKLKATSLPTSAYHAKSRIHHKSWSDSQVNQFQSVMGPTSTPSLIEILSPDVLFFQCERVHDSVCVRPIFFLGCNHAKSTTRCLKNAQLWSVEHCRREEE